jgi:hypothetical protein
VADYAVDFHMLAAESAWNPEVLFDVFNDEVNDDLAAWELPMNLDLLIALTIQIDGRPTGK